MMEAVSRYPKKVIKRKYCAKCQKHNMMKEVKGHKNDCPFTNCPCEHCRKIEVKRYTSRMNVKKRRADSLQEELAARRAQDANAEREACAEPPPPQTKPASINKVKDVVCRKLNCILQKAHTIEEARHRIMQGREMDNWPTKKGGCPTLDLLLHAIHKKAHTVDEARHWILQELAQIERLNPSELCEELPSALEREDGLRLISPHKVDYPDLEGRSSVDSQAETPPHLSGDRDLSTDPRDLRQQHKKDLLHMSRRSSVECCSPTEPPVRPKENDIPSDSSDLRPLNGQNELLDLDRRHSVERCSQPETQARPKESEFSADATDLRPITTQKGGEGCTSGNSVQPKVPWSSIQVLREEFKNLDVQKLLLVILKKAHTLDDARSWIMQESCQETNTHNEFRSKDDVYRRDITQKTTKEAGQESSTSLWGGEGGVSSPLGHHYQWAVPRYPGTLGAEPWTKDFPDGPLYSLPSVHYPRPESLAFHRIHPFQACLYSYTHPSTSYPLPGHEVVPTYIPRECGDVPWEANLKMGNLKPYEGFQKFENKETGPFGLHSEGRATTAFGQLQI